jgi:hypothetical protein
MVNVDLARPASAAALFNAFRALSFSAARSECAFISSTAWSADCLAAVWELVSFL